ncbi:DNA alkylation repair enzyme [uncultured archaeon]|nr:DNA alkylation repair enzyme [uncultured archaeon]
MLNEIKQELQSIADPGRARKCKSYFKTGKGQYAEGDIFIGVGSPKQRELAKKYKDIPLNELQELLNSKIHEYRQTALFIMVIKFKKAKKNPLEKRQIFELYMKNTSRINNWDLVDCSAPHIVGEFLQKEGAERLKQLAKSENLWERRIAIISTFAFIKNNNFGDTLAISDMLLKDEHDLIHKAVGWGLREVGKKNKKVLELFLMQRYKEMPRTMLRYAIEKFPEDERKKWMAKEK